MGREAALQLDQGSGAPQDVGGQLGRLPREAAGEHDAVRKAADAHGVSPQQVALAWLLSLSPATIPIPGASRPESIQDSVRAVELELTPDELERIG